MKLNLTLKYSDNTETVVQIPTSWSDLTLGQCIALFDLDSKDRKIRIKIMSIISGLSIEELSGINEKVNLPFINAMESAMQFINVAPDFKSFKLPKTVNINGNEIKVPFEMKKETYGQKVAAEELIRLCDSNQNGALDILPLMPEILSIYLYPILSNEKFKDERVDDFIDVMKNIAIKEAYPIASFFLIKRGIFYRLNEPV